MVGLRASALCLLLILTACKSGGQSDEARDEVVGSRVIYLVTDFGAGSDSAPTSRLMSVSIDGTGTREILQTRAVSGSFSVDPEGKKIGLTTNYVEPPGPELLLADLASGDIESLSDEVGTGRVSLGPEGAVAYCHTRRNDLRVGRVDRIDASESLEYRWGIQCPNSAWSTDSRLAFLADAPDAQDGQADLYLRDKIGNVERIDLPDATAVGRLDWSTDGKRVVLAAGESMMIVDTVTGDVTALGRGVDPTFSPRDATLIASVRWEPTLGIDVWKDSRVVASLDGDGAVAWCAGGELIVLLSGRLSVWDWRTGETRALAELNFQEDRKLIEPSLACV